MPWIMPKIMPKRRPIAMAAHSRSKNGVASLAYVATFVTFPLT
jgi:hypothetical protein